MILKKNRYQQTHPLWVFSLAVLAFSFVFLICGCDGGQTPLEKATAEGILLIGNGSECSRLDPQLAFHASERRIQMALFETLVGIGKDLRPEPALAERWEETDGGKTYRFYLRKGAQWSDGTPITAQDAAFSFKRLLSPLLAAEVVGFAFVIEGAEDYNHGKTKDFATVGVKALDSYTLEIRLTHPAPYFVKLMAYSPFAPLPQHTIEQNGPLDDRRNTWDKQATIVSSGPFKLKKWQLNQSLELEKNPYYWDASKVALNGIVFYPITDSRTEEQAFLSGQLHLTYGLPFLRVQDYLKKDPDLIVLDNTHAATELYLINTRKPALKDVRVRRALNLAIDRQALATLFPDKREAALGFVPPWVPDYQTPEGLLPYDPQKAKALLAAAGYPEGKGFPTIELNFSAANHYRPIAEALQRWWQENLGIDCEILQTDAKTNFYKIIQGDFDIGRIVWRVECADAGAILSFFASNSPANPTGWSSQAFDAFLEKGFEEKDLQKRARDFQAAETLLIEEGPIIPLFYQPIAFLKKPEVKGWEVRAASQIPYKEVFLLAN